VREFLLTVIAAWSSEKCLVKVHLE